MDGNEINQGRVVDEAVPTSDIVPLARGSTNTFIGENGAQSLDFLA